MERKLKAFEDLLVIMDELREKCPWDRKQTMKTLRSLTIEETYELADAIMDDDLAAIKEEIGDLLLHLVFYAKIGEEKNNFDIADIIHHLNSKLIRRHPHIYGDVNVDNENEVSRNWEQIKLAEKRNNGGMDGVLAGVPKSLPAMVKAYRMQEKTKQVGFEWDNCDQVWMKVIEELEELKECMDRDESQEKKEDEFGDVLFSLINYARFIGIDPENALEKTNKKFKKRFEYIESHASKSLLEMSLEEMDTLWNEAKQK